MGARRGAAVGQPTVMVTGLEARPPGTTTRNWLAPLRPVITQVWNRPPDAVAVAGNRDQ